MKKKILYGLLSLLVSVGLWLYVITVENPNSENTFYSIPVVLDNESVLHERGLMVLTEKTPTVTLKLSGNRSYLNKLNNSNITLVADLSRIYETGEQLLSYTIRYPGDIPQNSIDVLSQLPGQITLTITERMTQNVPVNVVYTGRVPEGYMTDTKNQVLDVKTINVTGPAFVVDEIAEARITVNLDNKTETISQYFTYTYYDKDGNVVEHEKLTSDVPEVKLTLKIQRYKQIALKLDVIPGGGATLDNTKITMDIDSLFISGSEQLLEGLDTIVLDQIDLGMVYQDTTLTYTIADLLPEGITNITNTEKVNVTIDLPDLETKTFQINQILPQNIPAGVHVDIMTKELTVTLRGPANVIDRMTADQIQVLVDFSEAKPGADSYQATIHVAGVEGVGAMGRYDVQAQVSSTAKAAKG